MSKQSNDQRCCRHPLPSRLLIYIHTNQTTKEYGKKTNEVRKEKEKKNIDKHKNTDGNIMKTRFRIIYGHRFHAKINSN